MNMLKLLLLLIISYLSAIACKPQQNRQTSRLGDINGGVPTIGANGTGVLPTGSGASGVTGSNNGVGGTLNNGSTAPGGVVKKLAPSQDGSHISIPVASLNLVDLSKIPNQIKTTDPNFNSLASAISTAVINTPAPAAPTNAAPTTEGGFGLDDSTTLSSPIGSDNGGVTVTTSGSSIASAFNTTSQSLSNMAAITFQCVDATGAIVSHSSISSTSAPAFVYRLYLRARIAAQANLNQGNTASGALTQAANALSSATAASPGSASQVSSLGSAYSQLTTAANALALGSGTPVSAELTLANSNIGIANNLLQAGTVTTSVTSQVSAAAQIASAQLTLATSNINVAITNAGNLNYTDLVAGYITLTLDNNNTTCSSVMAALQFFPKNVLVSLDGFVAWENYVNTDSSNQLLSTPAFLTTRFIKNTLNTVPFYTGSAVAPQLHMQSNVADSVSLGLNLNAPTNATPTSFPAGSIILVSKGQDSNSQLITPFYMRKSLTSSWQAISNISSADLAKGLALGYDKSIIATPYADQDTYANPPSGSYAPLFYSLQHISDANFTPLAFNPTSDVVTNSTQQLLSVSDNSLTYFQDMVFTVIPPNNAVLAVGNGFVNSNALQSVGAVVPPVATGSTTSLAPKNVVWQSDPTSGTFQNVWVSVIAQTTALTTNSVDGSAKGVSGLDYPQAPFTYILPLLSEPILDISYDQAHGYIYVLKQSDKQVYRLKGTFSTQSVSMTYYAKYNATQWDMNQGSAGQQTISGYIFTPSVQSGKATPVGTTKTFTYPTGLYLDSSNNNMLSSQDENATLNWEKICLDKPTNFLKAKIDNTGTFLLVIDDAGNMYQESLVGGSASLGAGCSATTKMTPTSQVYGNDGLQIMSYDFVH